MQQDGHLSGGSRRAPRNGGQGFNLLERSDQAAMTVPQNLKALVGMGSPVRLHGAATAARPRPGH